MDIALITGSAQGWGLNTAISLAQAGCKVYAALCPNSPAHALWAKAKGLPIEIIRLDITQPKAIAACVEKIYQQEGQLDVLVNCAGACPRPGSLAEREWCVQVNYQGAVNCTKAVLPRMQLQGGGHIINVSPLLNAPSSSTQESHDSACLALKSFTESLGPHMAHTWNIHLSLVEHAHQPLDELVLEQVMGLALAW